MTVSPQHGRLSADQCRQLGSWLAEFERSWDEKRLGARLRDLPPPGDPLRLALLLELVRIDLRRRWQLGQKAALESYLKACPELGTPQTAPAVLIAAEYQARLESGAPPDRADFARRFPTRMAELQQILDLAGASNPTAVPADLVNTKSESGTCPPFRPEAPALPEQFGRYRILRPLGKGGMGTVYLAQDGQLDRRVALKVPHFAPGDGPEVKERFFREAKSAATIEHPNICPVYDVGTLAGIHYLAMAYIEGRSLAEAIRGGKPVPERQAAALVRKLALALAEAHQRGIVHRDLKPSNVMINQRGEPVIMDFGLARRLNQEESRLTQQGDILGTPAYMSPEQIRGDPEALGPGCDVYGLGVILYELLAGQVPFRGSLTSVIARILTEQPRPLSELRPGIGPGLEAVCARALAKDPADRYGSMRQFAAALYDVLHGEEPTKQLPAPAPEPIPEVEEVPASGPRRSSRTTHPDTEEMPEEVKPAAPRRRPQRRRPESDRQSGTPAWVWGCVGAAAVSLLVVLFLVVFVLHRGSTAPEGAAGPARPAAGQPASRAEERPGDWQRFAPPESPCSVLMPGTPKYERQITKTVQGDVATDTYSLQCGGQQFALSYMDLAGVVPQGKQIEAALNGARNGLLQNLAGAKLVGEMNLSLDGYPGREWELETANGVDLLKVRGFLVKQRLYILMGETLRARAAASDLEKFLTSLQLTP
jgi:serine/threonine protein kinase